MRSEKNKNLCTVSMNGAVNSLEDKVSPVSKKNTGYWVVDVLIMYLIYVTANLNNDLQ